MAGLNRPDRAESDSPTGDDLEGGPPPERDRVVCRDPKTGRNLYRPTSSSPKIRERGRGPEPH
jgi:hypothetical protein